MYVAGLQEDIVTSPEHVLQLLEEGERSRHVGETRMNKNSSRSHTLFRMVSACRAARCRLPCWACTESAADPLLWHVAVGAASLRRHGQGTYMGRGCMV